MHIRTLMPAEMTGVGALLAFNVTRSGHKSESKLFVTLRSRSCHKPVTRVAVRLHVRFNIS